MKRALLLLAALTATACAEPQTGDPELTLTVAVSPTPAIVGPGRILLTLSDAVGAPVGGATVVVTGRSPGGDAPLDTALEQAPGSYAAAAFPFATPGEWTLEAHARLPDGRQAVARHPIRVVARPARP